MESNLTFGDTIRELRINRNLTLREVAEALNIDTSMLGKIEKNTRKPTLQLIEKISRFFNVRIEDLKVAFLSDSIAYKVVNEEDIASKALKIAEKKVKYLTSKKNSYK